MVDQPSNDQNGVNGANDATLSFARRLEADAIDVADEFTSIEVGTDRIPLLKTERQTGIKQSGRSPERQALTGARITVAFTRCVPVPLRRLVRICFDIAENGDLRELFGTPQLTHTTVRSCGAVSYHYRLTEWIPAQSIMVFVKS